MEHMTLGIGGMSCGHCVGRVTKALESVDGVQVEHVKVGEATVAYDPSKTSESLIAKAVEGQGYTVAAGAH